MNNQRNIVDSGVDEEMDQDSWQDESLKEDYGIDDRKKKKVNFVYFKL